MSYPKGKIKILELLEGGQNLTRQQICALTKTTHKNQTLTMLIAEQLINFAAGYYFITEFGRTTLKLLRQKEMNIKLECKVKNNS